MYLNGPNIILTSTNIVDPFFFISGFLMHLNVSRSIQKAKGLSQSALKKITSPIIHRVMRLVTTKHLIGPKISYTILLSPEPPLVSYL